MTIEELRAQVAKGARVNFNPGYGAASGPAGKYGNRKVEHEGVLYHSLAEFGFKLHLDQLVAQGVVAWFTRQVPFYLPGKPKAKRYVVDFLVVMRESPAVRLVDVKGFATETSKLKISVVQGTYPVKIEQVPGRRDGRYTWR